MERKCGQSCCLMFISEHDLEFPPIGSCFLLRRKQQHEGCGKLMTVNASESRGEGASGEAVRREAGS